MSHNYRPKNFIDLTGQRFGRWTVISYEDNSCWVCHCDCGTEKTVNSSSLRRSGSTGCAKCKPLKGLLLRKHGETKTRLYRIWSQMKNRCANPKNQAYLLYGGRGITVCPEWQESFEAFRNWAKDNGYSETLTIDRKNNDRGYSPENCRWATYAEQSQNRRYCNKPIHYHGQEVPLRELAKQHGLPTKVVSQRIRNYGWTNERPRSKLRGIQEVASP
jgi:hypothetical protein